MSQNEMLTLLKLVSYRRQTPAIGSLLLYLSSISLSLFLLGKRDLQTWNFHKELYLVTTCKSDVTSWESEK